MAVLGAVFLIFILPKFQAIDRIDKEVAVISTKVEHIESTLVDLRGVTKAASESAKENGEKLSRLNEGVAEFSQATQDLASSAAQSGRRGVFLLNLIVSELPEYATGSIALSFDDLPIPQEAAGTTDPSVLRIQSMSLTTSSLQRPSFTILGQFETTDKLEIWIRSPKLPELFDLLKREASDGTAAINVTVSFPLG